MLHLLFTWSLLRYLRWWIMISIHILPWLFPSRSKRSDCERQSRGHFWVLVPITGAHSGQDEWGSRPSVADGGGGRSAWRFRGNHAGETLQLLRLCTGRKQRWALNLSLPAKAIHRRFPGSCRNSRPHCSSSWHHGDQWKCLPCVAGASLLLRGEKPHLFLLGHSHGTDWVEYNAQGWLSHAKHNPAAQNAATLLQDSQKYDHTRNIQLLEIVAISNQRWAVYMLHMHVSKSAPKTVLLLN